MKIFYQLFSFLFQLGIFLGSYFIPKAKKIYNGRKESIKILQKFNSTLDNNSIVVWFHAASLGEFEQCRPLIEEIKKKEPKLKVVVSFFSSSGYEVRKNYPLADCIFYLLADNKQNAKNMVNLINPDFVFWCKYDFWYNTLKSISEYRNCQLILFSAIFREKQIFFKPWGSFYLNILKYFDQIFVQNERSEILLQKFEIHSTVSGDTRFDRVISVFNNPTPTPIIDNYLKEKEICFVIGSSWMIDIDIFQNFIKEKSNPKFKFIIAPHEIDHDNIKQILEKLDFKCDLYSDIEIDNTTFKNNILIINKIGLLSSIYKYADYVYIGGGFGTSIHNILEAAVYGMPIFIGPKHKKFNEAIDLIDLKGVIPFKKISEFEQYFLKLKSNSDLYQKTSEINRNYVFKNQGSSQKILSNIEI